MGNDKLKELKKRLERENSIYLAMKIMVDKNMKLLDEFEAAIYETEKEIKNLQGSIKQ